MAASIAVLAGGRYPQLVVLKEMFTGLDSFPLMAVPFFILAAELMSGAAALPGRFNCISSISPRWSGVQYRIRQRIVPSIALISSSAT